MCVRCPGGVMVCGGGGGGCKQAWRSVTVVRKSASPQ